MQEEEEEWRVAVFERILAQALDPSVAVVVEAAGGMAATPLLQPPQCQTPAHGASGGMRVSCLPLSQQSRLEPELEEEEEGEEAVFGVEMQPPHRHLVEYGVGEWHQQQHCHQC